MNEVMRALFTGDGVIIVQLMVVAVVAWIAGHVATAVGKGDIARLIHVGAVFVCLVLVIGVVSRTLAATFKLMGF